MNLVQCTGCWPSRVERLRKVQHSSPSPVSVNAAEAGSSSITDHIRTLVGNGIWVAHLVVAAIRRYCGPQGNHQQDGGGRDEACYGVLPYSDFSFGRPVLCEQTSRVGGGG